MHRACILVVEDDLDTRELLREILETEGFAVGVAPSGDTALAVLAHGEPPDLVILDLVLPGLDGWSVLDRMHHSPRLRGVRVLATSASSPRRPLPPQATFLRKPFKLVDLLETVSIMTAGVRPAAAECQLLG